MLELAHGRFPRRQVPLAAVRPELAALLRGQRLQGGRLVLLWSVRLERHQQQPVRQGGRWVQALQVRMSLHAVAW